MPLQYTATPTRGGTVRAADTKDVTSKKKERLAWQRLRQAIVEEYVEKLPEFLTIQQAAQLLRISEREVREHVFKSHLVARERHGSIVIVPADSKAFLMTGMLLRLPLPATIDKPEIPDVEILVSGKAFTNLAERASISGSTISGVINALLDTPQPAAAAPIK